MPIFRVPRDLPPSLSSLVMILDDPTYVMGAFEGFLTVETKYTDWFRRSSTRPIIDDCPMSGGRVLGGISRGLQADVTTLRSQVDTLQDCMTELRVLCCQRWGHIVGDCQSLGL